MATGIGARILSLCFREPVQSCRAGGVIRIYKDGTFFESWHDVSFNTDVDFNQSRAFPAIPGSYICDATWSYHSPLFD